MAVQIKSEECGWVGILLYYIFEEFTEDIILIEKELEIVGLKVNQNVGGNKTVKFPNFLAGCYNTFNCFDLCSPSFYPHSCIHLLCE